MAPIVVSCPQCAQKYRLPADKAGLKARCRCGQRFTVPSHKAVDEDTVFGWVLEGADASSQSVLNGTGIVESHAGRQVVTTSPARRAEPGAGVKLERLDSTAAHFEFPAERLGDAGLRSSFPKQCASCSGTRGLCVHLIVWYDKLPFDDPLRAREVSHQPVGRLQQLASYDKANWLDDLPRIKNLPSPFDLPFPFYACEACGFDDEVSASMLSIHGVESCRLHIANLDVAAKFYRNNGGKHAAAYATLQQEAERQRRDSWRGLPSAMRRQIQQWHETRAGEQFKAFFPDSDFGPADLGKAGLVLTSARLSFHKFAATREFVLADGGKIYLNPETATTTVRIVQKGRKDATVRLKPGFAERLVAELKPLGRAWKVTGDIRSFSTR